MQQLEMQNAKFEKIAKGYQKRISEYEAQNIKIEKAVEDYQKRISYMENSLSWKATKPLRVVAKKLKKKDK